MSPNESSHSIRTRLIHGENVSQRWEYNHLVVPPITSSATYRLDSVARGAQGFHEFAHTPEGETRQVPIYIYDRLDEPTRGMLEDNLAIAEGGDMALCFASGMAAISACLCTLCTAGDRIVAHKVLYGCTYSLMRNWLPRQRVGVDLVDLTNVEHVRQAITPQTRAIYFETPINPQMTIIDIEEMAKIAAEANVNRPEHEKVRVVVDNTFASPYCQRPLSFGADIVCCSLTKSIGGFGTDIGGAVIGPHWLHDPLILYRKDFGGSLSPRSAWPTLVYGLPSLATRMVNYQSTAMRVAKFLEDHPKVERVLYPGLESFPQYQLARKQMRDARGDFAPGCMVYFDVKDPEQAGKPAARLIDWIAQNSYCITLAVSLGQIKTLIECPYNMTHTAIPDDEKRALGVLPGGCRISCGLEDRDDLIRDLEAGLAQV
ncbi:MAG TPA: PLP-dependent aspartate aminotransferase family protein [Phycisphaerae bacterium]|nr:PLP-dependent transferase [Phycisphaerales bacterium]HRX85634.1 PLP-dependent aspartate aminotransferase family protein [Phycisphaerae bacterium]